MAKIPNYRRLVSEDYAPEYQELVSSIGYILNDFMQNVTDTVNGNIDFDNLKSLQVSLNGMQVDANGKPLASNQVNVGKDVVDGFQVIKIINVTNSTAQPDFMPNITFTELGNNVIRIDKIPGLIAGNKYNINIIVY